MSSLFLLFLVVSYRVNIPKCILINTLAEDIMFFPIIGYENHGCYEHLCRSFRISICFILSKYPEVDWLSDMECILNITIKLLNCFTIFDLDQQYMRVPVTTHLCQHLLVTPLYLFIYLCTYLFI